MLGLLLVLLFLGGVAKAENGSPGFFLLQMRGHFILEFEEAYTNYSRASFRVAKDMCFDRGGVPASDPNFCYTNAISLQIMNHRNVTGTSFYVGATASPQDANINRCHPIPAGYYNGSNCFFRWIYGFYDLHSYQGEPGTAFWQGIYRFNKNPNEAVLNNYEQYFWNSTKPYPHGRYYIINGINVSDGTLYRADCHDSPRSECANPSEMFLVVCEVQCYPENPVIAPKAPQPIFVQGWDDLTWAQEHWFVIYITFIVIILFVCVIITIYCWITSRARPVGKPINAMVIREYQGFPFASTGEDGLAGEHVQFSLNHWDAVDGGGNPPVDPEAFNFRNPLILEAPDADQYGNANCHADTQFKRRNEGGRDINLEGPRKSKTSPPTKDANSATASRDQGSQRRLLASQTSRHARSHTTNPCVFSEVDMPSAGEVHEANVEL
ncbi:unnamed protein product [Phytomonas sp. EM1]|nr:unnamed protein product [Phytomonas sp. EM1]|eukprot:CCW61821.1 unnamed protein product [Phytomonas sp. isolate EM1]